MCVCAVCVSEIHVCGQSIRPTGFLTKVTSLERQTQGQSWSQYVAHIFCPKHRQTKRIYQTIKYFTYLLLFVYLIIFKQWIDTKCRPQLCKKSKSNSLILLVQTWNLRLRPKVFRKYVFALKDHNFPISLHLFIVSIRPKPVDSISSLLLQSQHLIRWPCPLLINALSSESGPL